MAERIGFLERLRASDEDTKRLWVAAGTAVSMLVIVTIWLTWFNNLNTLANVSRGETEQTADISASAHSFSFFETVKSGVGALYHSATEIWKSERSYIIKPNN